MWISRYVCLFMIYSLMGWVYETVFCTIKGGKWENRGFLYGPVCPIYGTGAVAISLIMKLALLKGIELREWQIFVISVVGSAILEYFTAWALEKMFHATWWDYTDFPMNIQGRVSLFTSLGFGLGGLLTVYVIVPFTVNAVNHMTPIVIELLSLCFLFMFAVDLTLTVTALLHFDRIIVWAENSFNRRMEMIVDTTVLHSNQLRKSIMKKGHSVNEQINALSDFAKGAIRRVNAFRDKDERKKTIKNSVLSKLRNSYEMHIIRKQRGKE